MNNAELIESLRYCFEKRKTVVGVPWYVWCDRAADALEAAEKRIAEQQKQIAQLYILLNNRINEITKLEAQLPKNGEWIERDDGDLIWFKCSVCGKNYYNVHVLWEMMQGEYHHCPNCGSRMRKGEQE